MVFQFGASLPFTLVSNESSKSLLCTPRSAFHWFIESVKRSLKETDLTFMAELAIRIAANLNKLVVGYNNGSTAPMVVFTLKLTYWFRRPSSLLPLFKSPTLSLECSIKDDPNQLFSQPQKFLFDRDTTDLSTRYLGFRADCLYM